jgi:hypothetical protein
VLTRSAPSSAGSVSQDWKTPLSPEKLRAYHQILERLETSYAIFSVNLDEALGMRRSGRLQKLVRVLSISPALCERLARPLVASLRSMLRHASHFGVTPNLAPLNPNNFQNAKCQRVARFNSLLARILLTRKSQFLTKIEALAELTEQLASTFQTTAEELAAENSHDPDRDWELLDANHYDLNTCLRETVVILKCFLHALPAPQLSQFQDLFREFCVGSRPTVHSQVRHLAHRRMTPIKGQ